MNPSPVRVKFWGVRGSVPTPGLEQAEMGGNTACVEVVLEDRHPVILDGGTGLRALGLDLVRRSARPGGRASLLLSHLHWDHIQGIPFFAPMYDPDWAITFYSLLPPDDLRRFVRIQTNQPYFSARSSIRATLVSEQLREEGVEIEGMNVRPIVLHHPGGAAGFRIEAGDQLIIYVSDHEHGDPRADHRIRQEARHADLLIWDSQYTPDDYEAHRGWGHGTWLEGTRVAKDAGVKQLILFHHDPQRSDNEVKRLEQDARREFENAHAAREGLVVSLVG